MYLSGGYPAASAWHLEMDNGQSESMYKALSLLTGEAMLLCLSSCFHTGRDFFNRHMRSFSSHRRANVGRVYPSRRI
jgi:hypothetical protein